MIIWLFPKIGVENPPKWMVKIMENPIKIDDLGGPPLFLETLIYSRIPYYRLDDDCMTISNIRT